MSSGGNWSKRGMIWYRNIINPWKYSISGSCPVIKTSSWLIFNCVNFSKVEIKRIFGD
jgi:hypothetical protein